MLAKAVGGVVGIGLIGTGGIAMAKPHWLGIDYMPTYKVLALEGNFSTDYSNGKFGNKYGKYLTSATESTTEAWWKWALRRWEKDKPKSASKFLTSIEKGYESSGSTALNQLCKSAYDATDDSGFESETGSGTDKFKKSEVWKYCSPIGQEPKTIGKHTNNNGEKRADTIGKAEESTLISVLDKGNDVFWDIRNQEFYGEDLFKDLTSNQITVPTTDKFFTKEKGKKTPIKEICKSAYKENKSNNTSADDKPTKEETKRYCSLTVTTG